MTDQALLVSDVKPGCCFLCIWVERERGMVMLNYSCMCSEWWHTLYHLLFIEKANYHA